MKKNVLTIFALGVLFFSCAKEQPFVSNSSTDFTAFTEQTSKTVLGPDFLSVNWKNGDLITVSNGSATAVYSATVNSTDATKADFSLSSGTALTGTAFAAVYPSSASISAGTFSVTVPAVQNYVKDSFEDGALPMVAVCGEDRALAFKLAASVLCVKPSVLGVNARIMSVKVSDDNYIAGNLSVAYDGSAAPVVSGGSVKTVTLRAKSGSDNCAYADAIEAGTPLYIVLAPCTTSANLNITVNTIDEDATVNSFTIKPGAAKTFGRACKQTVSTTVKNLAKYVDLSSKESANCYMVPSAGFYKIKAVKGNGKEALTGAVRATAIWESECNWNNTQAGDIVKDVFYNDGYLYFTNVAKKVGNALVGVLDANGTMLWSWHIWVPDGVVSDIVLAKGVTFQDRNLGALKTTRGNAQSFGLIYQWGRKDPFLNGPDIGTNSARTQVAFSWPTAGNRDNPGWPSANVSAETNTIEYTIAHPTTKLVANGATDWFGDAANEAYSTARWTSKFKTVYDPCPAGYKVPTGDATINDLRGTGMANGAAIDGVSYIWDATNLGVEIASPICPSGSIWFPAVAFTNNGITAIKTNTDKNYGFYWTANYQGPTNEAKVYWLNCGDKVYWGSSKPKSYYMGVRCVKAQ